MSNILDELDAADRALAPSGWKKHYNDGHEGTVTPDGSDRWEYDGIASSDFYEEYTADIYCWPEGGPVNPRPHEELILLMANNIRALLNVAQIAKLIFPMEKPQGEYATFQVQLHAALVEKMQNALLKLRGDA